MCVSCKFNSIICTLDECPRVGIFKTIVLIVLFFEMKLDNFYYLEYLDYCLHLYCYIHVLADVSFSHLLVFKIWEPTENFKLNSLFNP